MKVYNAVPVRVLAMAFLVLAAGALYAGGRRDKGYAYGPGMMGGGYGRGPAEGGYGPGMMGRGNGYGYGMMGGGFGDPQANTVEALGLDRIGMDDARKDVVGYLESIGDKNLEVDEIMEFDQNFYALIKEKDSGMGAFELLVDPYRGFVGPEPGPNMMWNAKYGPMSWNNRTPEAMPVGVAEARAYAQKYLDGIGEGFSVEEQPDEFYGYYTVHVLKNDKIVGMLSVNGHTAQVWFHSWHGTFRAME